MGVFGKKIRHVVTVGVVVDKARVFAIRMELGARVLVEMPFSDGAAVEDLEWEAFQDEVDDQIPAIRTPGFPLDLDDGEGIRNQEFPWTSHPVSDSHNVAKFGLRQS